jgi:hypothetical protein
VKPAVTVDVLVVVGVSLRVFRLKRHTAVSDGGTGRRLGKPSRAGDRGQRSGDDDGEFEAQRDHRT